MIETKEMMEAKTLGIEKEYNQLNKSVHEQESESRQTIRHLQHEIDLLKHKTSSFEKEINVLNQTINLKQLKIVELESELRTLRQDNTQLKNSSIDMQIHLNKYSDNESVLEHKINTLKSEIDNAKKQIEDYKQQLASSTQLSHQDVELKESEVKDLRNKLRDVESRNDNLNNQIILLNKTLNNIKHESSEKHAKMQEQINQQNSLYNEYYLK